MEIKAINPTKSADFSTSIKLLNDIFFKFIGFKPYTTDFAFSRTKGHNPLIIEVYEKNRLVAYALCYERIKNYYHIWDIGTIEDFRKKGIASQIYDFIEKYAKKNKYLGISISTFNRFPNNIRLLISRGYQIYNLENIGKFKNDPKIYFRLNFK